MNKYKVSLRKGKLCDIVWADYFKTTAGGNIEFWQYMPDPSGFNDGFGPPPEAIRAYNFSVWTDVELLSR